ncbi:MAG: hypothetical protein K8L97_26695 [Anaerolineae bacterium]|nr:hypothetical protein [Anaerolineae bacterium]
MKHHAPLSGKPKVVREREPVRIRDIVVGSNGVINSSGQVSQASMQIVVRREFWISP